MTIRRPSMDRGTTAPQPSLDPWPSRGLRWPRKPSGPPCDSSRDGGPNEPGALPSWRAQRSLAPARRDGPSREKRGSMSTAERRIEAVVTVEPAQYEHLVNGEQHRLVHIGLCDGPEADTAPVFASLRTTEARYLAFRLQRLADELDAGYYDTRTTTICVPAEHVEPLRELFDVQRDTFMDLACESDADREYDLADAARDAYDKLGEAPIGGPVLLRGPAGPLAYLMDNYLLEDDDIMRARLDAARAARKAMEAVA